MEYIMYVLLLRMCYRAVGLQRLIVFPLLLVSTCRQWWPT